MELNFGRSWAVGEQIGAGGFGVVCLVRSGNELAVAKFIPKEPGAERELLFVDLEPVRNVIPIIESGETADSWVLVMRKAEMSLRDYIDKEGPAIAPDIVRVVLTDIATALSDLAPLVVHRDLKPENVLLLDGRWCLADFGIARYAEASTASETHKYAMSSRYAAPERWRGEHATSAADVYATGIIGYEMIAGGPPFRGPSREEFREQHLHADPARVEHADPRLAALVEECLIKAPQARPTPANLLVRLEKAAVDPASGGLARLHEANRVEVNKQATAARHASEAASELERRQALVRGATHGFEILSSTVLDAVESGAPLAIRSDDPSARTLRLGPAQLAILVSTEVPRAIAASAGAGVPFDVVAYSTIVVSTPADTYGYVGRSHSLWFCDAQDAGSYGWFETAFMVHPLVQRQMNRDPFAVNPGEDAPREALGPGMGSYQVAWPFTPLNVEDLGDFLDRWVGWFADAAAGSLHRPGSMPEISPDGSWRRS